MPGAGHAVLVGNKGRENLGIAVGTVGIHKERNDTALQPAAQPPVEMEPLAGYLSGGLRVQDAQISTQVPVGLRLIVKVGRLAPAAQLHIFSVVLADRHALMGDIGDGMDDDILLFLQLGQLGAVLGDLIGKLLHLRQNGGNILALLLILRYQLRDPVLLGLHVIHRRINGAPLHIDLQDLIDLLIHILVAALHRSLYPLRVLSYYLNIQHQNLPSFCLFLSVYYTHLPSTWQAFSRPSHTFL